MTPQHFLIIPTYCVCFSLVTVIFVVVGKEWAFHYQLQQIHQAKFQFFKNQHLTSTGCFFTLLVAAAAAPALYTREICISVPMVTSYHGWLGILHTLHIIIDNAYQDEVEQVSHGNNLYFMHDVVGNVCRF